jgi:S1-C subfamily serine protease
VRATGELQPGERVWIIGDKTGSSMRVSQGAFDSLDGNNAFIGNTVVEEGFSGSPVLDDYGRLVGIASAKLASGKLYIVRTETIAKQLQEAAPETDAARVMSAALPNAPIV